MQAPKIAEIMETITKEKVQPSSPAASPGSKKITILFIFYRKTI